jgi:hypothetical protein
MSSGRARARWQKDNSDVGDGPVVRGPIRSANGVAPLKGATVVKAAGYILARPHLHPWTLLVIARR